MWDKECHNPHRLRPPSSASTLSGVSGGLEPFVIFLGVRSDGCTYELDTNSLERLKTVPNAMPVRRVFIAYETRSGFEQAHGPFDWQAAQLLTGLSADRLASLGAVELYDPRSRTRTVLTARSAA